MKKMKAGILRMPEGCSNCKHSSANWCVLHQIAIFQGATCDSFELDAKKEKKKLDSTDLFNKHYTISQYKSEQPAGTDMMVELNEVLYRIPKKTAEKITNDFKEIGLGTDVALVFWSTWDYLIDPTKTRKDIHVGEVTRYRNLIFKTATDILYERVCQEIGEEDE